MPARDVPSTISPCGICRQVLREFCALNMPIFLVASNYDQEVEDGKTLLETTLGELLPHSFGPEHLELPRS
jgi:cytidine deaminase